MCYLIYTLIIIKQTSQKSIPYLILMYNPQTVQYINNSLSLTSFTIPSQTENTNINKLIIFKHNIGQVVQHIINNTELINNNNDDNGFKNNSKSSRKDYLLELAIMEALTNNNLNNNNSDSRKNKASNNNINDIIIRTKNPSLQQFLNLLPPQSQSHNEYGLNNISGLIKLDNICQIIVQHCQGKTKDIHKIVYLVCKYLLLRLKYKLMQDKFSQNQREDMLKQDVLDLYDKTSLLFIQQLQHPPVLGQHTHNKHTSRQSSPSRVHQASQRQKSLLLQSQVQSQSQSQSQVQSQQNQQPKQSGYQLHKFNKYAHLLQYIQQGGINNMEKLLAQLEETVLSVHQMFNANQYKYYYQDNNNNVNNEDNKNHNNGNQNNGNQNNRLATCKEIQRVSKCLTNKLYAVIQILLTIIYMHKVKQQNQEQMDQQHNINNKIFTYKSNKIQKQQQQQAPSALLGPQRCQTYNHLSVVLDYIIKILKLSQKQQQNDSNKQNVLKDYCGFNIYLYAKMSLMYGNKKQKNISALIAETRNTAYKYMSDLLGVQIDDNNYQQQGVRLSPIHSYLLNLYSLPIHSHQYSIQMNLMQSHNIIQQTINLLYTHPLYCYLIPTLYFHLGLIDKQLYTFDQEYQSNILRELLLASTGNRDTYNTNDQDDNDNDDDDDNYHSHRNNEHNNYQNSGEHHGNYMRDQLINIGIGRSRQMQRVGSLDYNQFDIIDHNDDHRFVMPRQSDLFQSGSQAKSPILHSPFIDSHPSLTPKILLHTICLYKSLHLSRLQSQHKFNTLLSSSPQQQHSRPLISNTNMHINNNQLPLSQLIDSLLSSTLCYQQISTIKQIQQLRQLSKYSLQVGLQIQAYFMQYLRVLVRKYVQSVQHSSCGIDRYGLLLMEIQINTAISASKKIFQGNSQLQANPHYSTETFNVMYYENFITHSTLNQDFNYVLLDVVREIAGMRGQMWKCNKNVAKQFQSHFEVLFQLQKLTKRGKLIQQLDPIQNNSSLTPTKKSQHSTPLQSKYQKQLSITLYRLQKINQILSRNDTQSCNQVLRVSQQLLQDYYKLKQQIDKQVLVVQVQQNILDKIGDQLVTFIGNMRHYVVLMEQDGYGGTELVGKFRDMIF